MRFFPKRRDLVWDYFDASDDPLAHRRCRVPDTVTVTLERLGFECIGVALAILRMNRAELVHEIWASDDGITLAEIAEGSGRVELVTLFDDGTIVKTAERPALWDWLHWAPGARWHPRARVTQTWPRGPLDNVVAVHRARIAKTGKTAVPGASMQTHFATRLRIAELRDATIFPQIVVAFIIALAIAIAVATPFGRHFKEVHGKSFGGFMLTWLLAGIALIPTHHLSQWFIAPYIVRLRAPPPPRDAAALLEAAREIEPGFVYRY